MNNELAGKTISLWGLSFKPNTNDMRDAPSLVLIEKLLEAGCTVRLFDPVAMPEAKEILAAKFKEQNHVDAIYYATDIYDAALDADALLLVTEWKEFRMPSWGVIKKTMKGALILDGRNIYDKVELNASGFEYEAIG